MKRKSRTEKAYAYRMLSFKFSVTYKKKLKKTP